LMSALAMAATVAFRAFSGIVAIDRDRVRADGLLTAGLEVAAGMVANADDIPLAAVESTVTLSSGRVRLRLDDEGGRIDIGQAPVALLAALFRAVGAPDADTVAQRIVHWRDADAAANGKSATSAVKAPAANPAPAAAAGKPAPNPAQNQVFTDVHDLLQIPGVRPEWLAALAPLTTVFGNETVNPLTAPPEVLAVLPGVARGRLASFLDAPQAVSVRLAARLADGYAADAAAVIVSLREDRQPYRILAWKPLPPPNP
jgi:general secretion pathway protein K